MKTQFESLYSQLVIKKIPPGASNRLIAAGYNSPIRLSPTRSSLKHTASYVPLSVTSDHVRGVLVSRTIVTFGIGSEERMSPVMNKGDSVDRPRTLAMDWASEVDADE